MHHNKQLDIINNNIINCTYIHCAVLGFIEWNRSITISKIECGIALT